MADKVKDSLYDVCKCGDYRYDHDGGKGCCDFSADLSHGYTACLRFRLSERAKKEPDHVA